MSATAILWNSHKHVKLFGRALCRDGYCALCTNGISWSPATTASKAQQIYWAVLKETLWDYYLRVQKRSNKVHTRKPTTARALWRSVEGRTSCSDRSDPCPQRDFPLKALPGADISLRPKTLNTPGTLTNLESKEGVRLISSCWKKERRFRANSKSKFIFLFQLKCTFST